MSRRGLKVTVPTAIIEASAASPPASPKMTPASPRMTPASPKASPTERGDPSSPKARPIGMPSPKDFKHSARRVSDAFGSLSSFKGLPAAFLEEPEKAQGNCLNVFPCQEVRDVMAVGNKVWTADRRTPKVMVRNIHSGDIEREILPPNKTDFKLIPDKNKEHIFPWCLVHVRFPKLQVRADPTGALSDTEEQEGGFNRSFKRDGTRGMKRMTSMMRKRGSTAGITSPLNSSFSRSASPGGLNSSFSRSASPGLRSPPSPGLHPSLMPHKITINTTSDEIVDEVWVGFSNGCIRCYSSTSYSFLDELKEQGGVYSMVQWGQYVYSGSNDWTIRKYDASNKILIGQFLPGECGHSNAIRSICIAGDYLASASDDFTIRLWEHQIVGQDADHSTGRCIKVLQGHKASVVTVAYCDRHLWSGGEDSTVMVWNVKKGTLVKSLADNKHVVTKLVALPKINTVLCCSVDNVIRIYDSIDLTMTNELRGHTGFVHSCAPVATELRYQIWSSSQDSTLRVWMVGATKNKIAKSISPFVTEMDDQEASQFIPWKLAEVEAREAALRADYEDLKSKLAALQEADQSRRKQLEQSEGANKRRCSELNELNELLDSLNEKIRTSDQTLSDYEKKLATLQQEKDKLLSEEHRLKRSIKHLHDDTATIEADRQNQATTLNDLKRQIEELKAKNAAHEEREQGLLSANYDLKKELESERHRSSNEHNNQHDLNRKLEDENSALKSLLQTTEDDRDQYYRQISELNRSVVDLRKTLNDQTKKLGNAKSLSNLEADAREALGLEKDMLHNEITQQASEILFLKEQRSRMAIHIAEVESCANLSFQRAAMCERRSLDLESLRQEHAEATSKLSDLSAQLASRSLEADRVPNLLSELLEKDKYLNKIQRELSIAKNAAGTADEDNTKLSEELEKLRGVEQQNENLQNELCRMRSNLQNNEATLRETRKRREQLSADNAEHVAKTEEMENELRVLMRMLDETSDEKMKLREKVKDLERRNIELELEAKNLRKYDQERLRLLNDTCGDKETIQKMDRNIADLEERLRTTEAERDYFKNELNNSKDLLQQLKNTTDSDKTKISTLQDELNSLQEELDGLHKSDMKSLIQKLRQDINDRDARIHRSEQVLSDLRNDLKEANAKILRFTALEADNHLQQELRDEERAYYSKLEEELLSQEQARDDFNFILQSRTDFIQAVYDWYLCSGLARKQALRLDNSSSAREARDAREALVAAVDGAHQRGQYILSNYVSELEKHHLGVSPSLYPADPVLQQMFKAQRLELSSFLKGRQSKESPTTINRIGIKVDETKMNSVAAQLMGTQNGSPLKSTSKYCRSFTPPAAFRKVESMRKNSTRNQSPPRKKKTSLDNSVLDVETRSNLRMSTKSNPSPRKESTTSPKPDSAQHRPPKKGAVFSVIKKKTL